MKAQYFILTIILFIGGIRIGLNSASPKTITKVQTVTKTVQLPAPKTYICNAGKQVDLTSCFEIDPTSGQTYCFGQNCSYIYTDKELQ